MTEPTVEQRAAAYDRVMEVLNNEYTVPAAGWQELREAARIQPTESERLAKAVAIANERVPSETTYGDPFDAGMAQGHKDLLVMNEDRRQHVRTVLADLFDGDFNFADRIIGTLHAAGCEIVTTDVVFRQDDKSELLELVERLSEVDPYANYGDDLLTAECIACDSERQHGHKPDCPFLLLEQWKAESE